MKRTALSLMILGIVFGAFALDVDARGRGRGRSVGSNRSSFSRSSNSGSRQRYQSRAPRTRSTQRATNRNTTTRNYRSSQTRTTRNLSSGKRNMMRYPTTKPRPINISAPKPRPRPMPKPIDPGIGNGQPAGGGIFTRPGGTVKPGTITPRPNRPGTVRPRPRPRPVNNSAPKPRPMPKPIDPGIGNGKPAGGGVFTKPGGGGIFTRPGGTVKPGTVRPRPNRPGTIKPRPRPRPDHNSAPKPRPRPRPPVGQGPPKPRPPKPQPGHGHGNGHGHGHGHGHHHHRPWHVGRPQFSWWWFNYCTPLRTCAPADFNRCDFVYTTCDFQVPGGEIIQDVRWYLGLKGLMLPGKGIGIDAIEANSPAALAGLKPGMVITKCNGVVITDDAVFGQVIAESGGILEMELLEKIDGELLGVTIQMTRLVSANF